MNKICEGWPQTFPFWQSAVHLPEHGLWYMLGWTVPRSRLQKMEMRAILQAHPRTPPSCRAVLAHTATTEKNSRGWRWCTDVSMHGKAPDYLKLLTPRKAVWSPQVDSCWLWKFQLRNEFLHEFFQHGVFDWSRNSLGSSWVRGLTVQAAFTRATMSVIFTVLYYFRFSCLLIFLVW